MTHRCSDCGSDNCCCTNNHVLGACARCGGNLTSYHECPRSFWTVEETEEADSIKNLLLRKPKKKRRKK